MVIRPSEIADLVQQVAELCRERFAACSVEEAEQIGLEVSRALAQGITQALVEPLSGKATYDGCSIRCSCGHRAQFKEYRPRWLSTLCGPVSLSRAYYYCRHCKTGYVPWDVREGLSQRYATPGLKSLVAQFAGRLSYASTAELLALSTGLEMEESCAENIVGEVGERIRQLAAAEQEAVLEQGVVPLLQDPPERLYVAKDGTSAHIDGAWHEVKTSVVYRCSPGEDGFDTKDSGAQYVAAQESAEEFGERVYAVAVAQGVQQAREVIVIGDGAEWIWKQAAHHYPHATQIVDYWHASEHIWELRRALYPPQSDAGDRWATTHCKRLLTQGPDSLLRALRQLKPTTDEAQTLVATELGYFTKHKERMAYPQFRRRGLMIGSGCVEASCKVVVGQRLKQSGMRWSHKGADAVLAIRADLLSHNYDRITQATKVA
jgi:hypothetical protein